MINRITEKDPNNIKLYLERINFQDVLKELPEKNSCQFRVSLTQLCNESCFFCHNEGNPKKKVEFDDEIFKKSIDVIYELNNILLKGNKTQEKCKDCSKKNICGGEAEYLRLSPDGVLNPCLALKEFDINLKDIKGNEELFEKGFLLGLRRIKNLDL